MEKRFVFKLLGPQYVRTRRWIRGGDPAGGRNRAIPAANDAGKNGFDMKDPRSRRNSFPARRKTDYFFNIGVLQRDGTHRFI
ncbi:hypothetical protein ACXIUT_26750 [Achromobacter denitrificans]